MKSIIFMIDLFYSNVIFPSESSSECEDFSIDAYLSAL